jgi:hypothetical protein
MNVKYETQYEGVYKSFPVWVPMVTDETTGELRPLSMDEIIEMHPPGGEQYRYMNNEVVNLFFRAMQTMNVTDGTPLKG